MEPSVALMVPAPISKTSTGLSLEAGGVLLHAARIRHAEKSKNNLRTECSMNELLNNDSKIMMAGLVRFIASFYALSIKQNVMRPTVENMVVMHFKPQPIWRCVAKVIFNIAKNANFRASQGRILACMCSTVRMTNCWQAIVDSWLRG
jgi:hypothetical protein